MPECLFCTYQHKYPELVLMATDHFFIIPNAFPTTPKYLLIVSREHLDNQFCLPEEIWHSLQDTINDALQLSWNDNVYWLEIYNQIIDYNFHPTSICACQKALHSKYLQAKPTCYNVGINVGTDAGQTINHFHLHVLPRYHGDSTTPCGIGQIIK